MTLTPCHHHPDRDAVARCPSCSLYFCRECVVEHDGKILCATCLRAESREKTPVARRKMEFGPTFLAIQFAVSLIFLWFCFYATGRMLLKIPADFHDGTVWKEGWLDE